MIVPFAHMGHAIALLPFFAPPIVLTLGLLLLIARERLFRRGSDPRAEPLEECESALQ